MTPFSTFDFNILDPFMVKQPPFFHVLIATGFGAGYSSIAPGTAGALVACAIWGLLFFLLPYMPLLVLTGILILLFTILGIWSTNQVEPFWGKDPSRVVVDEMVGVWIPLLAVPHTSDWFWYAIAAFALFRLFDIFKPLGIRKMEDLKGGIGVMMDDILAGVYSLIILLLVKWWIS